MVQPGCKRHATGLQNSPVHALSHRNMCPFAPQYAANGTAKGHLLQTADGQGVTKAVALRHQNAQEFILFLTQITLNLQEASRQGTSHKQTRDELQADEGRGTSYKQTRDKPQAYKQPCHKPHTPHLPYPSNKAISPICPICPIKNNHNEDQHD